jgi:hypothetical protein
MHRSGTSTVAGALGVLGATMPATGLGLSQDNPKGHFEPKEIVALHDRVLASAAMRWWDWEKFPDAWYESPQAQPFVDELVQIVRAEFGEAPLFVVKDPRTCKLIPLWRRAAAILDLDVAAVLPFRHPDEVARSLHARDGFPLPNSHMAWLRYVLEAERESRGMRRVFLDYRDLLEQGPREMRRVVRVLGLPLPSDTGAVEGGLQAFIDPDLRRARADSEGAEHLHPWLRETLEAYARAARAESDDPAHGPDGTVLDRIHAAFGTACDAFVPALHATNKGFEDAQGRNMLIPGLEAERDAARAALEDQAARHRADLAAREAEITGLTARLRRVEEKPAAKWWQRG